MKSTWTVSSKTFILLLLATLLALTSVWAANVAFTANANPGSADDPLVTKSYVDQQVNLLVAAAVAQLEIEAGQDWKIVQVAGGRTLIGGEGTELIVRNGRTFAYSPDGQGFPDLTSGSNLSHDAAVSNNHLLQIPREGRGVRVDSNQTGVSFVLVRGTFRIE